MRCLVIGATGYVGSRLVPRLLDAGHAVRCLVRGPAGRLPPRAGLEAVRGDMTDAAAVARACRGVDAVFFLAHSMDGPGFADRDRTAARVLAAAAGAAGVSRVVYLGGLQPDAGPVSAHLASRREVGDLLLAGRAPAAVLQAGIVVGVGSASFEMVRRLAALGPVLPLPDRAWNRVQPIGVDDVLHHLLACLGLPAAVTGAFDVGGPDVLTYAELVARVARAVRGTRPLTVPVPLSAPRTTARAVAALTPVDRHLAGPLLESLAHDLVCRAALPAGPPPGGPTPFDEAVRRALAGEGAAGAGPLDPRPAPLVTEHVEPVRASAAAAWDVLRRPRTGVLHGVLDPLLGRLLGLGADRWRVEAVGPGRVLRLRADGGRAGSARIELRVEPDGARARLVQRLEVRPRGLAARARAQLPARAFLAAVAARTIAGVVARP